MKLNPQPRLARAFTLKELVIVIVLVLMLGLTVTYFAVKLDRSAKKSARIKCAGNLKQIGLGFRVFANDNDDKFPFLVTNSLAFGNVTQAWLHFQAMSNEMGSAKILVCPSDRGRWSKMMSDFGMGATANATSLSTMSNHAVSFTVGLEADETQPNAILSSDQHLATNRFNLDGRLFLAHTNGPAASWTLAQHEGAGNYALSDGSVQQGTSSTLASQFAQGLSGTGLATNRLLLPLLP
jgi:type II secretory pathway pseudopilin PulG